MSRPIPPSCKTKNWQAYNAALKQRGSLTIWFDPDMVWVPPPTGKQGRQPFSSLQDRGHLVVAKHGHAAAMHDSVPGRGLGTPTFGKAQV